MDGKTAVYEDPLTFAIATEERSDCEVSYVTTFITNEKSKANELWKDFKEDGLLKGSTKSTGNHPKSLAQFSLKMNLLRRENLSELLLR